jgi:hypothetical protein
MGLEIGQPIPKFSSQELRRPQVFPFFQDQKQVGQTYNLFCLTNVHLSRQRRVVCFCKQPACLKVPAFQRSCLLLYFTWSRSFILPRPDQHPVVQVYLIVLSCFFFVLVYPVVLWFYLSLWRSLWLLWLLLLVVCVSVWWSFFSIFFCLLS